MPPIEVPITSRSRRRLQALGHEQVLRAHHVLIAIPGKASPQSVTRLARLAVPDGVWHDDEVPRRIERLAGAEQFAGKPRSDKLRTGAAGAMDDQHGVADASAGVPLWSAHRAVVQPQLRQHLAGREAEVADDVIRLGDDRRLRTRQTRHHATRATRYARASGDTGTGTERIGDRGSRIADRANRGPGTGYRVSGIGDRGPGGKRRSASEF